MINQHINNIEARFTPFIKLIMILFSFIFVFASIDTYKSLDSTISFNKIFFRVIGHEKFFSLFEIVFIFMVFLISMKFRVKKKSSSNISKIVFFIVILTFILKMLNPNNDSNNPILGMPLFSDISNFTFILLAYFSLFLDEKAYMVFFKKLFYYIGIILTVRVFYLLLLWLLGKGNYGFGANSTLTESDTLYLVAFFQIAFFTLYLINKEKKYLILWIVYLLFQILSYRRSALAVALSANALYYIFILLKGKGIKSKVILISGIILFYGAINNIENFNLPFKYERYILRFVSAVPGMALEKGGEFTDSGHWEQTSETFYSAIHTLGFWGHGYRGSHYMYLEGQTTVIHNAYAATWARWGFYMFLFYLFIIIILLYNIIKLFLYEKIINKNYYILKISVCLFLLMWFAVLTTNPLIQLESFKMQVFWVTLFTIILRISSKNVSLLLSGKIINKNNSY